jgi:hypothetical protein
LVMLDQAGIPRPRPHIRLHRPPAISLKMLVGRSPDILATLIVLCGFVYFFVLQVSWSPRGRPGRPPGPPIFGNLANHLIPSERLQGIFFLVWLGSALWLMFGSRTSWSK